MTKNRFPHQKRHVAALLAATLISASFSAHGDELSDLEKMRSTTMSLIEALVDSGVISRQKASKLIQDAEDKAKARMAELPGPEFKTQWAEAPKAAAVAAAPVFMTQAQTQEQALLMEQLRAQAQEQAKLLLQLKEQAKQQAQFQEKLTLQASAFGKDGKVAVGAFTGAAAGAYTKTAEAPAPAPEFGKDGKKIVRVPYIPDAVKREMREQIKQEVLAQSKTERWGEPGALPEWLDRFSFEGDVRMRYEMTRLGASNTAPGLNYTDGLYTRAADIVGNAITGGKSTFNTQNERDRWRLRARLGVNAKISDTVSAGLTLSTGNTSDRTSTNQTLGQNFNKYSVVLDRAFIKLDPLPWLSFSAGRIANPYFGTDLVWADDLNFEGLSLSLKPKLSPTINTFITAGWFPLRESSPGKSTARDLFGVQAGVDWKLTPKTKLKLGAALYEYRNIEGKSETNASFASASDYATRYEYADGFRQRGNTLFFVNAPADPNVNWGLASKFRELNITGALDFAQFGPLHVTLTGDYVKNLGFDRAEIASRTGFRIEDGKDFGYMGKVQVGHPKMTARGDWNISLAYRYLGSDAVLDAFTNSDFGLGGTNNKGTILGFTYGIDKNSWLSARWLSSDLIDPMVPKHSGTNPRTKLSVDLFQLDLNARF